MNSYYKIINDKGYITSIGVGFSGEAITEEEYDEILNIIKDMPEVPKGFRNVLKSDKTWEMIEDIKIDTNIIFPKDALAVILGRTDATDIRPNIVMIRKIIEKAMQLMDDETAFKNPTLYPSWESLVEKGRVETYEPGFRFCHNGEVYKCVHAFPVFQSDWVPGVGTESLYIKIDISHSGEADDPIPFKNNMVLEEGKYYSQYDEIFECIRSSGSPIHTSLLSVIGIYVRFCDESNR